MSRLQDESCTVELACWDLVLETIDALTADFFAARTAEAPAPNETTPEPQDATAAPEALSADARKCDSPGVKRGGAAGGRGVVVPVVTAQPSYGVLLDLEPPNSPWSLETWRMEPKGGGDRASSVAEKPVAAASAAQLGRATPVAAASKACVAGRMSESAAPDEQGAATRAAEREAAAQHRQLQATSGWEGIRSDKSGGVVEQPAARLGEGHGVQSGAADGGARALEAPLGERGEVVTADGAEGAGGIETEFVDAEEMQLIEMALQTAGVALARTKAAVDAPSRFLVRRFRHTWSCIAY